MLEGQENNKDNSQSSNMTNESVSSENSSQINDSDLVMSTISKNKTPSIPDQNKKDNDSEKSSAGQENTDEDDKSDLSNPNTTDTSKDNASKDAKTNTDLEKENALLKKRLDKARESIGKYSRQKNEWQERYNALEAKYAKIEATEPPEREDYASDEAYNRAMAKFDTLKDQAIERIKKEYTSLMTEHTETFKERIDTQVKDPAKFHATMQKYGNNIASNEPIIWKAFNESPIGPMVMDFFITKIFTNKDQANQWRYYTDMEKTEYVQNIEKSILQHVRKGTVSQQSQQGNAPQPPAKSNAPKSLSPNFSDNKNKNTGLSDLDLVMSTIKNK